MRDIVIAFGMFACLGTIVTAETPQQEFVKAWKGRAVVVKRELYSLVYNERGRLGNTRIGQREGLLVVTSPQGEHLQFDGRQGRDTVIVRDPALLIKAVANAYQGNTLDVRSYRRLEPVAIERFVAGAELVVRDVRIDRDQVTLELAQPAGQKDTASSLRIKWPVPLSPSFSERRLLEGLLRRVVEIKGS